MIRTRGRTNAVAARNEMVLKKVGLWIQVTSFGSQEEINQRMEY